ncbi:MAG: right-handed parallel beta-helix repeat-containing protein [Planctomycetes bacterium]|nr:right-handed parallel beta-helix repeat-containing protein [Planctomycetota bacterium]
MALWLHTAGAWCTTYYVAPNGNNANPGSIDQPWATPGYGSKQLQPGDTLIIRGGRYVLSQFYDDMVTPPSGAVSQWITIRGEDGQRPILAGRDNLFGAIYLSGLSYIRIENLEITHDDQTTGRRLYFRDGLDFVDAPCSSIILKDLYIHHLDEFGINVQDVQNMQIINCQIEYCGFGAVGGPAGSQGGWRNVSIQGCSLSYSGHYYQGGDGSNRPYDRPDGFGIEPSVGPIEIVDTIAKHNYGDGLDSKASNTTIRRCIVANNSCDGVKLWGGGSLVENTLIYGRGDGNPTTTPWAAVVIDSNQANDSFSLINVTVDDFLGNNYLAYVQYDLPVPINLTIRNSIFCGMGTNSPIWIRDNVQLTADHNLFYLPDNDIVLIHGDNIYTQNNIGTLGEGNLYGDLLFIAPAWGENGDYHLQSGSPAIDTGSSTDAPNDDLQGFARDVQPDIGAYEYSSSNSTMTTSSTTTTTTVTTTSTSTTTFVCQCRANSLNGCISGTVRNFENRPLIEKIVKLRRTSPIRPKISKGTKTEGNGCYRFVNLPYGTYEIWVRGCPGGDTKTIVLSSGEKVNDTNFQCE